LLPVCAGFSLDEFRLYRDPLSVSQPFVPYEPPSYMQPTLWYDFQATSSDGFADLMGKVDLNSKGAIGDSAIISPHHYPSALYPVCQLRSQETTITMATATGIRSAPQTLLTGSSSLRSFTYQIPAFGANETITFFATSTLNSYQPSASQSFEVRCNLGYQMLNGSCSPCRPGWHLPAAQSSPPGAYSCQPCSVGSVAPTSASTTCTLCAANTWAANASTLCSALVPGQWKVGECCSWIC
jgi:hypothetical protein